MRFFIMIFFCVFAITRAEAQFPLVQQGDLKPNDTRLGQPIDVSKVGELTIASFNVRNLGSQRRSLADFAAIADLVDEADVVVIQEAGLGLYRGEDVTKKQLTQMQAVLAILQVFLGKNWELRTAALPSGTGNGSETSIIAYRKQAKGFKIKHKWVEYVDLGERRDMAVFKLEMVREGKMRSMLLGSVHLTPDDPHRGEEMMAVAEWLVEQRNAGGRAVVMGDFNWGYKKASGVENYRGEEMVMDLHDRGELFHLFRDLAYLEKSDGKQLRTNMGFRKNGNFYDVFLTTPNFATRLADGGRLLEDCGFVAFGMHSAHMKDIAQFWAKKRGYGLEQYVKHVGKKNKAAYEKAQEDILNQAQNDATFNVSDHRVIWMQLKIW